MHGGNLVWAAKLAGCSPSAILDFSASINPLGPPDSAIVAIQNAWEELRAYPDPNYTALCAALSQFHQVPPEWVLPGNGSAELLTWACRDLAELTATYLITPAFGDYRRALKAFEAKTIERPLKFELNPQPSKLTLQNAFPLDCLDRPMLSSCGLLLNNPHNPTGALFDIDEILPYLEQFRLVVVDEAFMDFLLPGQQQSLIDRVATFPNLVILRSLTKFYSLPGLRLGYAIAHPDRLNRWQQWRDPWTVNTLAAIAAIAIIQDTAFQQRTWDWLQAARLQLWQGLANLPGLDPLPGAANFLLVRSEQSTQQLQQALLQRHRILIRDCLSFAELGDRYFRVAVRTEAENQRLLAGLAEVLSLD
ncbi:MAG: threonine-phosphate decarboxylase CobD [Scytolyngbya sp. HA4215-MV1]|jgi:L-threonine-O-3-phosphate decarboxylase|nr:threonine-phosphate decarboxylase CobD [Scytolyngbya sp. HA4215-MV1]